MLSRTAFAVVVIISSLTFPRFHFSVIMDSVIISGNGMYLYHLDQFLKPVVGGNSKWKLCYRRSVHSKLDYIFHANCDGKNNTFTIIKKDEFVFGGFSDIQWGNKLFCTSFA